VALFDSAFYRISFGSEDFAFSLGADQRSRHNVGSADYRADQHWHREAHMSLDCKVGNQRRNETREDHSGVVAETARCGPQFGRESLGHVTGGNTGKPCAKEALDDKSDHNPSQVIGEQVDGRDNAGDHRNDDKRGAPANACLEGLALRPHNGRRVRACED
jgi:hypothetical protein